jgi:hypothetical protein
MTDKPGTARRTKRKRRVFPHDKRLRKNGVPERRKLTERERELVEGRDG